MKNIKLALLCLALSNIIFIKSMEEEEEEEYSSYWQDQTKDKQRVKTYYLNDQSRSKETEEEKPKEFEFHWSSESSNFHPMNDNYSFKNPFEAENSDSMNSDQESINDQSAGDNFTNYNDLLNKLASLNFSQDAQKTPFNIVEEFFDSTNDIYTALIKCFDYISTIDQNWDGFRYENISHSSKELIYFIVKKISSIEDIIPLFRQAIEENNNTIKTVLICSRIKVTKFSEDDFYHQVFERMNCYGFRDIAKEYQVMIPYLSNVHRKLLLPLLILQNETGYPLLNLGDTLTYGFLNGNKKIIYYILLNNLIPIAPIFKAALEGNREYLEEVNFEINQIEPIIGLSLLGFAAINGNIEIAELLIKKGANIELANPLHVAAYFGSSDIVIMLIKLGANINAKCRLKFFQGIRPLDMALAGRYRLIAQLLFDLELHSGIEANDEDLRTSFERALSYEHNEIALNMLTSYPTCFTASYLSQSPYPSNITPLHVAVQNNWVKLVKFLINSGIKLNKRTSKYNESSLHCCLSRM